MQTMTIGELKTKFSEVIKQVKSGQRVVISYGKKREKIAVMVPYSEYAPSGKRELGLLKHRAGFKIKDDFGINDEELLIS
jgi:prevent-host-death family protein